jgi:oligopeptide/dipeptide ABC transporter ATP-binding protein
MNLLLEVKNLKTQFIVQQKTINAVNDISFSLYNNEVLGIVGESGSGKSVTVRSILRIINYPGKIVHGNILFRGADLLSLNEKDLSLIRGKEISMIFQEPSAALNPVITVGEQISEVLKQHIKLNKKQAKEEAIKILKDVGIPAPERRYHDYPHQLSGGMQQRCVISIALACKPKLLIADEPTTSLDVTIQAQILSLIVDMVKRLKIGLIFITHDIGVVSQIADKIIVMYAGKIVEEGPTSQIIDNPKHPYTIELLDSLPTLSTKKGVKLKEIKGQVPDLFNLPSGCSFHPRCSQVKKICINNIPNLKKINNKRYASCFLY